MMDGYTLISIVFDMVFREKNHANDVYQHIHTIGNNDKMKIMSHTNIDEMIDIMNDMHHQINFIC